MSSRVSRNRAGKLARSGPSGSNFLEAGLEAKVVEYQVLLPMPKGVKVDLVEPFNREGPTPEGGWTWDKDSYDSSVVPAFNVYSPPGAVSQRVVYANYGLPERFRFHRAFYAIGVYTGYESVVIRSVRQAIERKDWATAGEQLHSIQAAIERGTVTLSRALETVGEGAAGN